MKKFRVQVKETFICYIDVEAKDRDEAYEIVGKMAASGEIVASRDYDRSDRDISVGQHPDDLIRKVEDTGVLF